MKGITPIIATILLILIVVALGGVFAAWTMSTWSAASNTTATHMAEMTERLQRGIAFDNVNCAAAGEITIRNVGTNTFAAADLIQIQVYYNTVAAPTSFTRLTPLTWTPIGGTTLGPNGLASATHAAVWASGVQVRITVGGGEGESIDTWTCA